MRVIECDECGETLQAANDEELAPRLAGHMRTEHGRELDDAETRELLGSEAYDALDS